MSETYADSITTSEPITRPPFVYTLKQCQEQFSVAYIHAISAASGYSVDTVTIDEDSIDITISQRGSPDNPEVYPKLSTLKIQLKCTYSHQIASDNFIHYPLPVKNYNDLKRTNRLDQAILVVLCIPSDVQSDWLIEENVSMRLHKTAHWLSLRGQPPTVNSETVTVKIPYNQRLDVAGLRQIMDRLARGETF